MTYYFAWVKENDTFTPHKHKQNELEIFQLTIVEEENHFPKAHILIQAKDFSPHAHNRRAFISWEKPNGELNLLFQGSVNPTPLKSHGELLEVELLGIPDDKTEQLSQLSFYHHPLFEDKTNSQIMEDAHPSSLYCNRSTLKLSRSNWFDSGQVHTLGPQIFDDSIQLQQFNSPLSKVNLQLRVEWTQSARGLANVGKDIAQKFPNEQIASYTPIQLKDGSLKPGQRLGRSGYWVIRSDLRHVDSQPMKEWKGSKHPPQKQLYDWDFWVGWRYEQKRVEEVELTLTNPEHTVNGLEKQITMKLNNPYPTDNGHPWLPGVNYFIASKVWHEGKLYRCVQEHLSQIGLHEQSECWELMKDHSDPPTLGLSSFFTSEQGQDALKYAKQLAWWYLAKSGRNLKVSFKAPWEDVLGLSTDNTIKLQAPQLPEGKITGKVSQVTLHACGKTGERWGQVTLTCMTNQAPPPLKRDIQLEELESPPEGLSEAPQRLLHSLTVTNPPQRQKELLESLGEDEHWRDVIDKHPTRLNLSFTNLKSCKELVRRFRVK